jgi:hypothetical protein
MKTYLVGGAVRDHLLGRTPKDRDYVVTGATPEDMLALGFTQVGASFPVFLHPETGEEHALARTERKNGVGYHGFDVAFEPTPTIEADLQRRDLTINSMAMDMETGEIIDPYGGLRDLRDSVLRHTSPAFSDDPLRVIRLARFAARFPAFTIAPETLALAQQVVAAGALSDLPVERHVAEFRKVLASGDIARFMSVLNEACQETEVPFWRTVDRTVRGALLATRVQHLVPVDRRPIVMASLLTSHPSSLSLGGLDGGRLWTAVQWARSTLPAPTPDALLTGMTLVGVFGQHTLLADLVLALRCLELTLPEATFALSARALADLSRHAIRASTGLGEALAAQGLDGRDIGAQVRQARLAAITANLSPLAR